MEQLKNLLKLDYYVIKSLNGIVFVGIVSVIAFVIGFVTTPSTVIMVILTCAGSIPYILFEISGKSNFKKLYGILPIRKSDMVIGKYIFSSLVFIFSSIVSFVLFCIVSLLFENDVNWFDAFLSFSICFLLITFVTSIQFPFYFTIDFSKAALVFVLPYLPFGVIEFFLFNKLVTFEEISDIVKSDIVKNVITYFEDNIYTMIFGSIGIGSCLMILSCIISIFLVKKKGIGKKKIDMVKM